MKKYISIFCILISLYSCKKSAIPSESPDPDAPLPDTSVLHSFEIKLTDLTSTTAGIEWTSPVDNQKDSISYTVLLDSVEVASKIKNRQFVFSDLRPTQKYYIQIKAIDIRNNSISSYFDFTTIDVFTKFSKSLYYNVVVNDIALSKDNGYVMCIWNANYNNLQVLKVDSLGNEIWNKFFSLDGRDTKIRSTHDGYFIMGVNNYILKIDFEGNQLWYKVPLAPGKYFTSFFETKNGNILLTGWEDSPVPEMLNMASITELNYNGDLIWHKTYGTTLYSQTNDIIEANTEGDFFVLGTKENTGFTRDQYNNGGGEGNCDFWLFKMDQTGNILWEKTYGDLRYDFSSQIRLINNQLIFGGFSNGIQDVVEMQLFRTQLDGNLLKTISVKSPGFYDHLYSIEATSDNGYIVAGSSSIGNSSHVLGLFKYDALDNKEWEKTYAPSGDFYWTDARSVKQTADNGYIVPANKWKLYGENSSIWLLKLNPAGSYE